MPTTPMTTPRRAKKRPGVNFTNILGAAFLPIFFHQKLQSQTVRRKMLHQTLLYKKAAC